MSAALDVTVHEVMVCAVAHDASTTDGRLMSALAIRCDAPDALVAARVAAGHPLHLSVVDAFPGRDRTEVALLLEDDTHGVPDILVSVPSAGLGLWTALTETPVTFHGLLVADTVALDTRFPLVDMAHTLATVMVDPHVAHEALHGLMHPSLTVPMAYGTSQQEQDSAEPEDEFRDRFFTAVAGIADHQRYGYVVLSDLGQDLDAFVAEHGSGHPDLHPLLHALDVAFSGTRRAFGGPEALVGAGPKDLDADATATEHVIERFRSGAQVSDVTADHPFSVVVAAAAANLAARAQTFSERPDTDMHPPRLLAQWMSDPGEEPGWAVRALASSLLAHDVSLARGLFGEQGEPDPDGVDGVDEVLARFLHVVVYSIVEFGLSADEMVEALDAATIHHPGHANIVDMARTVLDMHAEGDPDRCLPCAAMVEVAPQYPTVDALASTAAGLLSYLVDLHALLSKVEVGDAEWVRTRQAWMRHTLDRAA